MYYTIYKITNNINSKIYIGVHKTDNIDDGYFGSGKYLKRSINKYGIENFTKEIMCICHSAEEMFDMESILVNEEFVKRADTYNIKEGGCGGFDYINKIPRSENHIKNLSISMLGQNNPMYGRKQTEETKQKISNAISGEKNPRYGKGVFIGKQHTEETKQKIGKANSKHQKGQGNANYGKSWIYCPYTHESKSVPRYEIEEWEDKGWVKGRKII